MKNKVLFISIIFLIFFGARLHSQNTKDNNSVKILLLAPDRLGANYNFCYDNFECYGWDITTAGMENPVTPCPWGDDYGLLPLTVDSIFTEIANPNYYDVLSIQTAYWRSGIAYGDITENQDACDMVASFVNNNIVTSAGCAGPRVFAVAGVAEGVRMQSQPEYQNEINNAGGIYVGTKLLPIIDDNIVTTTRGMYFHYENCEALLTALEMQLYPAEKNEFHKNIVQNNFPGDKELTNWTKTFGGTESEGSRAIELLPGEGFLLTGYTFSNSNGYSDALLIKTDLEGNMIWDKHFGNEGWEYMFDVKATSHNHYLMIGQTSTEDMQKQFYVVKTDTDGNEIWSKNYGGDSLDIGKSILETTDGYYLMLGYTESYGAGRDDIYLIKTDKDGSEIWAKTYGGIKSETAHKIIETSDGNYVILGSTGSTGWGNRDIYLIKTDTTGNEIWAKTFGTDGYQDGFDVVESSTGEFYIAGHTDVHGDDFLDTYIVKVNADGGKIWAKRFDASANFYDYAKGITETDNGNFMITGATKDPETRSNDAYIFLINPEGELLWSDITGEETGSEWTSAICRDSDNNFYIAGHTYTAGEGKSDVLMFKISDPLTSIKKKINNTKAHLGTCTPNPFSDQCFFEVTADNAGPIKVAIRNLLGQTIITYDIYEPGTHRLSWDGKNANGNKVQKGVYLICLESKGVFESRKVVVY